MLSDAKLRAVSPKDKAFKLSDGQQLYLFVTPQGGKLWRMDYNFDGKRKSLSLGPYPLVSLLEARVKRDDAKRLLAEGIDPSVAKKLKVKANVEAPRNTFEKIAREWHEANSPQWAKPRGRCAALLRERCLPVARQLADRSDYPAQGS